MSRNLKIGSLNYAGLEKFSTFVHETRANEDATGQILPSPSYILTDLKYLTSAAIDAEIDLEKQFKDRMEFAKYLDNQMGSKFVDSLFEDHGLWAWLALAYFDQLRNTKLARRGALTTATQREEHFIPDEWRSRSMRNLGYRHSVRTPFRLVKRFGNDARFFISSSGMSVMGEAIEQLLSDPRIFSSSKLLEVIFHLYRDRSGTPRKGAFTYPPKKLKAGKKTRPGFGGLRRLTDTYLPRIKLTCDVDEMTVEQIQVVCGPEFLR